MTGSLDRSVLFDRFLAIWRLRFFRTYIPSIASMGPLVKPLSPLYQLEKGRRFIPAFKTEASALGLSLTKQARNKRAGVLKAPALFLNDHLYHRGQAAFNLIVDRFIFGKTTTPQRDLFQEKRCDQAHYH